MRRLKNIPDQIIIPFGPVLLVGGVAWSRWGSVCHPGGPFVTLGVHLLCLPLIYDTRVYLSRERDLFLTVNERGMTVVRKGIAWSWPQVFLFACWGDASR